MFPLLNRFAWVLSILISLYGWNLLFGSFNEHIFRTFGFFGWILVFIGAAIVKKLIFSDNFIRLSLISIEQPYLQMPRMYGDELDTIDGNESGVQDGISYDSFQKKSLTSEDRVQEGENVSSKPHTYEIKEQEEGIDMNIPKEPSVVMTWIRNFFSDRPLAKVGGILLFLGALFFLYLVFDAVGPVGKVLIGLAFGLVLIMIGAWLDRKNLTIESRVLIGIGIAVNYLTILSGRHLLSLWSSSVPLFSDIFTTIALILNSALAITLALVYRSNVLLGFSFIFAYATPFLVDASSSSVILLTLYATILTSTMATILFFYGRMNHANAHTLLESIAIMGMTVLFSLAMNHASGLEVSVVFGGLALSVLSLGIPLYREKRSPLALLIGAYFVLFIASFSIESFLFPITLILLFIFAFIFLLGSGISFVVYSIFGMISLVLGLFSFWFDSGAHALIALFGTGIGLVLVFGFALSRVYSSRIGGISLFGFALFLFLGISTTSLDIEMWTFVDILSVKAMALFLLLFGSVFALRMRDMMMYFLAVVLSGILLIYPNLMERAPGITLFAYSVFSGITFLIPVLLVRGVRVDTMNWLYASFPISSLVIAYSIYQAGQAYFPGIMLGVAYIIQGVVSLGYAMVVLRTLGGTFGFNAQTVKSDTAGSSLSLVLLAIPLSLFTFAIAFLFRDIPGMMSLAWVVESVILYFVYSQKGDVRIQYAAHIIFAIGILKEMTLIGSIASGDWASLPILIIMLVAVFASLFFLRKDTTPTRVVYDVFHMIGVLLLGYGIGSIIPHTSVGWSLLGITFFIAMLSALYAHIGKIMYHAFHSMLFIGVVLMFMDRFDFLNKKGLLPLLVQGVTLLGLLWIGYSAYRTKHPFAWFQMGVGIIGTLVLSSWYVDVFFGTFAVSLYLAMIASMLIIRGIIRDIPIIRTIGLYIGIYILLKIFFHDIWLGNNGTITRVIALMVTGGAMIYLSQLYGKYVSRSWSEELRISTWFQKGANSISDPEPMETDPFLGVLKQDLSHVNVDEYSGIQFQANNGDQFVVRRTSVLRLAKHITDTYRRTTFQPHELESAYQFVLLNLESTLPKKDLDVLLEKIKIWIEQGGSVNYISKS